MFWDACPLHYLRFGIYGAAFWKVVDDCPQLSPKGVLQHAILLILPEIYHFQPPQNCFLSPLPAAAKHLGSCPETTPGLAFRYVLAAFWLRFGLLPKRDTFRCIICTCPEWWSGYECKARSCSTAQMCSSCPPSRPPARPTAP